MAHKRMFSKSITTSDAFREMPASSQALYFHLGMEADDDGFLDSYRGMMRAINSSDDDMRILIAKRFLILFPSKVVVVKHWKINNDIKKDRYHETKHLEEKRALIVKENGSYTELNEMDTERIQLVSKMDTQDRIGKERIAIGKDSEKRTPTPSEIASSFFEGGDEFTKLREDFLDRVAEITLDEELKKFVLYWTEPNKSGTKVRWQQQSTFEVRRRFISWLSRMKTITQYSRGRGLQG